MSNRRPMFDDEAAKPTSVGAVEHRIAATRAALDPDRRAWRNDIVISAAVELLATRGGLSEQRLCEGMNAMWRTTAVTRPQVERALAEAHAAGLVEKLTDLDGRTRWQATLGAVEESPQDREWTETVLDRFRSEIRERLDLLRFGPFDDQRLRKLAGHLQEALARGTAGIYSLTGVEDGVLRPVSFDARAIRECVRRVQPKSVRQALYELADAALDPDEGFAHEMVHLLVVGGLLQGFLAKRDLAAPRLAVARILIDTSELVDLVDDGAPGQELLVGGIELSRRVGVEVVVAEHILEEWTGLWAGADHERPDLADERTVAAHADRLAGNPFVAQFLRQKATSPGLTWARFGLGRRDIRGRLAELGVTIRAAGNDSAEDRSLASAVLGEMWHLAQGDDLPFRRTRLAAGFDAESCAMVVRWRRERPGEPCSAYFLSKDRLTGLAYQRVRPDDPIPLTLNLTAWTMYVASHVADDPRERAELAEIAGRALMREGVLGVATQYTLEETLELSDMMSQDGERMSLDDARAAVQANLLDLVVSEETQRGQRVLAAAGELLRRRSRRRDERAKRGAQLVADSLEVHERTRLALADRDEHLARLAQRARLRAPASNGSSEYSSRSSSASRSGPSSLRSWSPASSPARPRAFRSPSVPRTSRPPSSTAPTSTLPGGGSSPPRERTQPG